MTNTNSLGIDPLTNSNSQLSNEQNFSKRESGYSQENVGPINLDQPSQPINAPIQTPPVLQQNIKTLGQLPSLETAKNPAMPNAMPNVPPIEEKQKKSSDGKINIVLVIAIFLVVIVAFVLMVLIMLNNSNNQKNTDNSNKNTTPTSSILIISPTIQYDVTDNTLPQAVYDNTRIFVTSPLPNQFISKEGVTITLEGQMKGFFEGTMGYRVLDEFENKLSTGVITADGDNYISFVDFSKQITISPLTDAVATRGRIEFYETSMRDGSINILATIPLRFQ